MAFSFNCWHPNYVLGGSEGQPEDVAYGALFLASDESSFMTGSELVIDGCLTLLGLLGS